VIGLCMIPFAPRTVPITMVARDITSIAKRVPCGIFKTRGISDIVRKRTAIKPAEKSPIKVPRNMAPVRVDRVS